MRPARRGSLRPSMPSMTRDHLPVDASGSTAPEGCPVGIDLRTARRNTVLGGLDDAALAALLPDLRETPLVPGHVCHESGQEIDDVHFPLVGVVSIVADLGADQWWRPPPSGAKVSWGSR